MNELLWIGAFLAAWFVLQLWILPWLGFNT